MKRVLLAFQERLLGTSKGALVCSQDELNHLDVELIFDLNDDSYQLAILSSNRLPDGMVENDLVGLRAMLATVSNERDYVLLSSAAQIATWHASFRYCPRCAAELTVHQHEFAKVCSGCGHHQYPRISPCIIVLVRKGEQCLLAHASKFQSGRYSTLAGFIEAGESAEHAVGREVMEEVGIRVKNIEYCFSQSWPFPHSLMLGYMADFESGEITPDGVEILDADWFSPNELPMLPPPFTIARRLIDKFLQSQGAEVDISSALFFPTE